MSLAASRPERQNCPYFVANSAAFGATSLRWIGSLEGGLAAFRSMFHKEVCMGLIILLIVLVLLFGGGGFYVGPPYHYYGGGLSVVLVVVIIVLLLRGA
jgi:hypothetical protein